MKKFKKQTSRSLLISFCVVLLLTFLFFIGFMSQIQLKLSDGLYGGKEPLNNIVILAIDDKSLQEIGRWPWNREVFVNALEKISNATAIGIDVAFFENYNNEVDESLSKVIKKNNNVVMPVEYRNFEKRSDEVYGKDIMLPAANLSKAARNLGYIHVITDNDGVTRAINTNLKGDYDSFVFEIYKVIFNKKPEEARSDRVLINFVNKPGTFKTYSFTDLLNNKIPVEELNDKIIFIGATSPDLHDDYFVPTSKGKAMPGVEIHANILQEMITKDYIYNINPFFNILIIILFSLVVVYLFSRFNILLSSVLVSILLISYTILGIILFDNYNLIVNFVYPVLSAVITYVLIVAYYYFFERKAKAEVVNAFSKYVSPVLVNEILKDPSKLKLGGDRREISIMFSDIRGFTSISEKLSPEELVNLLNEYLTEMTNIILKNNGVVDKYMGDAIMAFWNAPLDEERHAELACLTALEMKEKLLLLHKKWEERKIPVLHIGIGINTGDAVIGNMGSYDRFDYTAMGDNVNLGSRLEGLNKEYGTSIIISDFTYKKIKDKFICRELDLVMVKGKKEAIKIFELVGEKNKVKDNKIKFISKFEEGLNLYREQKWKEAINSFENAINIEKDATSQIFIERSKFFEKENPGKDWNKVWVMKNK